MKTLLRRLSSIMLEIYKMFPFLICKTQSHKAFQHFSARLKQRRILVLTKLNLKNRLLLQLFKAAVVVVVEVVATMETAIVEVTILDNRDSHHNYFMCKHSFSQRLYCLKDLQRGEKGVLVRHIHST